MTVFSGIINSYGDDAVIVDGTDEKPVKCLIQPIIGNKTADMWRKVTDIGRVDTSRWYGFFDEEIKKGNIVRSDGEEYRVLKSDHYTVRGKVSHYEAVLVKKEKNYVINQ